jgi:hypothetical protein
VIERPRRRRWRAGYVIVPAAVILGLVQIVILSRDGIEAPQDRGQQVSAPEAPESPGQSAKRENAPTDSAGAADAVARRSIQVFIHHAAGASNALPAIQLAAYLQTRGFAVSNIRPVDVEIERASVRYFFEGDRPEASRLVETIRAFLAKTPGQAPDHAADFSHISPKPPQGHVDVWLPPPRANEGHSA